jgi:RNA polymerase sigma-70 factor (ECF subfamily)
VIFDEANGRGVEDAGVLMARVCDRDAAAFEALYDAYHRLVYGIALRMLGDRQAAEDVTQAVFLKLWNAPDAYVAGNFGGWLSRVTRNRSLDALRSRSARPEGEMPADIADDASLDDEVLARIEGARVREALAALPEEQRTLIELGFFSGVTHEELARRTNTPLGTVKTRIRSGLGKLRSMLESGVAG